MPLSAPLKQIIQYAGRPTDRRGLLPIDVARKILKGTSTYPGSPSFQSTDEDAGQAKKTLRSKEIHAALVSLEDAAEVLGHLTRITWGYPLYDATTLVERYGAAVLPWFAGVLTAEGNLELKAWKVAGALVMLGSEAAFELVLKARLFHCISVDDTRTHPIGDLATLPDLSPKARIDIRVENTIDDFMAKHPQVVARVLAKRTAAAPKHKRFKALVKRLALAKGGKAAIEEAFGSVPAEAVTAKAILEVLDAGAGDPSPQAWPKFSTGIEDDPMSYEYFGLRLIGARSKKSEDWAVVVERISGSFSPWEPTRIERFSFSSNGFAHTEHPIKFVLDRIPDHQNGESLDTNLDGVVVKGPAGSAKLSNALVKKHDLKPGYGCELEGDAGYNLRLRAYLAIHPGAFWEPAKTVVKELGIADAVFVVESDAFCHVVGATYKKLKPTSTWRGLPSKSKAYLSLAKAIVKRDSKLFVAGKSNVDVRLHAIHKT